MKTSARGGTMAEDFSRVYGDSWSECLFEFSPNWFMWDGQPMSEHRCCEEELRCESRSRREMNDRRLFKVTHTFVNL